MGETKGDSRKRRCLESTPPSRPHLLPLLSDKYTLHCAVPNAENVPGDNIPSTVKSASKQDLLSRNNEAEKGNALKSHCPSLNLTSLSHCLQYSCLLCTCVVACPLNASASGKGSVPCLISPQSVHQSIKIPMCRVRSFLRVPTRDRRRPPGSCKVINMAMVLSTWLKL